MRSSSHSVRCSNFPFKSHPFLDIIVRLLIFCKSCRRRWRSRFCARTSNSKIEEGMRLVYDTHFRHFRKDIDDNKFLYLILFFHLNYYDNRQFHFIWLVTISLECFTHNLCHAYALFAVDSASFPFDLSPHGQSRALARKTLRSHYCTRHPPLNQCLKNAAFSPVPWIMEIKWFNEML